MIIGLAGAAGSGKDTAAAAIIAKLEYVKMSFAAPLKAALNLVFGWSDAMWEDSAWKEAPNPDAYGLSPRQLAQSLGTEWGRNVVDPNIWVDAAIPRPYLTGERVSYIEERYIFTDVRFPNEAKGVRTAGGVIIFVTCIDRATSTSSNAHESELWMPWLRLFSDCEISADFGNIDALKEAAVAVAENYIYGNAPRFAPSGDTVALLNDIHARTLAGLEQERG